MRKILISVAALALFAGTVQSEEIELDTDLMHSIEDTNKSLASNIAVKDADKSIADAKELEDMFNKVETFFADKGKDDAISLSKKSKELTGQIIKSVSANDFDTATNSATNLSRTCRTCHTFYKKS